MLIILKKLWEFSRQLKAYFIIKISRKLTHRNFDTFFDIVWCSFFNLVFFTDLIGVCLFLLNLKLDCINIFISAKPGMFNFKDKAKWEAWNGKRGLSKDAAKQQYIDKVKELIRIHGLLE